MDGIHPTVPSVKMVDALTSYISSNKYEFKFSLLKENGKFQ